MPKTLIGGVLLTTLFVFGAIVPLVFIGLLGFGLAAAVLGGGRRLRRHAGALPRSARDADPSPSQAS
jgi:cytochrome c biogenesis protein CcdA